MGKGGKGKGKGGKSSGKAGGKGGGKGGKGKGKGKGKRKSGGSDSESEDPRAAKRRRAGAKEESHAALEPAEPAPPPRPSRPGFASLLTSYGLAESDAGSEDDAASDDESGGEDGESEEEAVQDPPQDGEEATKNKGQDGQEEAKDDVDEEEEEEEKEVDEEEEEEDEVGDVDVNIDLSSGANAEDGEEAGLLNFYPQFWNEENAVQEQKRFPLPGLARCEASRVLKDCDVDAILTELKAASPVARFGLAQGVRSLFEHLVAEESLQVGPREWALFAFLHAYLDVSFLQHTHLNARAVRALCMLHAVDHVCKARMEVINHSMAAKRLLKEGGEAAVSASLNLADQGFCRARVLVLCPFKSSCHELVTTFLALCPNAKQVMNRTRFEEEYADNDSEPEEKKNDQRNGAEWQHLFKGNNDDSFRLGIAINRQQVRLYAPFDKSDILFCSPIGLRQIVGTEGDRHRDYDFLSSIEVVLVDRADVLHMQNWEHVLDVMQVVNRKPQAIGSIDISRLRPAFAEGRSRAFRQTAVTSAGRSLDTDGIFSGGGGAESANSGVGAQESALARKLRKAGQVRLRPRADRGERGMAGSDEEALEEEAPAEEASSSTLRNRRGFIRLADPSEGGPLRDATALGIAKQFFLHVPCRSLSEQRDQLFKAFQARYWRPLGSSLERLVVVAPTYLDFLRLRKYFREEGSSFCSVFEYAKNFKLSQARMKFFHGKRKVLLCTERFLWYRRYRLKGADYVLFYGPPEMPEIYEHVLGNVRTPSQCNSMCLFSRFDGFALERIVGRDRAKRMLVSEPGKVFAFS